MIDWHDKQEDEVQKKLFAACSDYRTVARDRRKGKVGGGPTNMEINTAVNQVEAELSSDELIDALNLRDMPPTSVVDEVVHDVVAAENTRQPRMDVNIGSVRVRVFLSDSASPNDPYFAFDFPEQGEIMVMVNMRHPHISQVRGTDGFANYLRHCVFDSVAEYKTVLQRGEVHPNTVRMYKDGLLRVPIQIEERIDDEDFEDMSGELDA
ncbi:hypothetical protein BH11ARM1_BH11ARM1_12900 [soil metagenome]